MNKVYELKCANCGKVLEIDTDELYEFQELNYIETWYCFGNFFDPEGELFCSQKCLDEDEDKLIDKMEDGELLTRH